MWNNFAVVLLFVCCFCEISFSSELSRSGRSRILSRKRRYVTFPEGSSFSCAACMTVGLIGQPSPTTAPGTFTFGMNWGIAYELPNETQSLNFLHQKKKLLKAQAQRRSRRELYGKIESILDNIGYNGRQCILKTICESSQRIVPHGDNMIEEMFRTLFSLPVAKLLPTEPMEHAIYDAAHRLGKLLESCDVYQCPISLVDLVKGYYNAPVPNIDPSELHKKPWALFSNSFG
ncbi:unnamed protein product [Plutella xylostella]|nr:uncharacterized protein LOC105385436 [Plutella xylostella]CAG9130147.1 unnamed protein product [Plutella xylostella]